MEVSKCGAAETLQLEWVELDDPENFDFFLTASSTTHRPRSNGCKFQVSDTHTFMLAQTHTHSRTHKHIT